MSPASKRSGSGGVPEPTTSLDKYYLGISNEARARKSWRREGWSEPRDARQKRLYVNFWIGPYPMRARYMPQNWTRPSQWVEDMVRA